MKKWMHYILTFMHIIMTVLFFVSGAFQGYSRLGYGDVIYTIFTIAFAFVVIRDTSHGVYYRRWLIMMEIFAFCGIIIDCIATFGKPVLSSTADIIEVISLLMNAIYLYGIGYPIRILFIVRNQILPGMFNISMELCLNLLLIAGIIIMKRRHGS